MAKCPFLWDYYPLGSTYFHTSLYSFTLGLHASQPTYSSRGWVGRSLAYLPTQLSMGQEKRKTEDNVFQQLPSSAGFSASSSSRISISSLWPSSTKVARDAELSSLGTSFGSLKKTEAASEWEHLFLGSPNRLLESDQKDSEALRNSAGMEGLRHGWWLPQGPPYSILSHPCK